MKQIEATILGQSYRLVCTDEGEAALHAAVRAVDREMSLIHDAGRIKAREKIAVLAALNLASQKVEREQQAPPPAIEAPATEAGDGPADPAVEARIRSLIERIDSVLGEDGHLL
ncbi:cell division protein ZapA [Aquariibacter albus]|uniref:Cell division protein ZapA n=1 Tax=Aquariibacter albus TaxID=2759899 RepID=A0A839HID7_9BURK|nr:cell division protein ZapA [Aquariibacter albus]MBB1162357.1 cell division protein ZapA [Aquariibacter albus]